MTDLDDMERGESCPYWDSNTNPSALQPVASRYTDWAIPAPEYVFLYISYCLVFLIAAKLHYSPADISLGGISPLPIEFLFLNNERNKIFRFCIALFVIDPI
jgi:hypothetical protein